jgi:quinol monooxygenase YgiN
MKKLSQDQMVKNLIRDYPVDALEFFEPDIIRDRGLPEKIEFNLQEIKKHSQYDMNMKNDLAVTYTFKSGQKTLLVLIEHWSDKAKFDIHRFAHYIIDLNKRFPDIEILPIALFTDRADRWRDPPSDNISIGCMDKIYLEFRYRLIRMKDYQAELFLETKNRFLAVMRAAMKYDMRKKIFLAVEMLTNYYYLEKEIKSFYRNSDIIEYFLVIGKDEKDRIIEELESKQEGEMVVQELLNRGIEKGRMQGIEEGIEQGIEKGIEKGIEQGIEQTVLSMRMNGLSYAMVQKITGLSREKIKEIEKNK